MTDRAARAREHADRGGTPPSPATQQAKPPRRPLAVSDIAHLWDAARQEFGQRPFTITEWSDCCFRRRVMAGGVAVSRLMCVVAATRCTTAGLLTVSRHGYTVPAAIVGLSVEQIEHTITQRQPAPRSQHRGSSGASTSGRGP